MQTKMEMVEQTFNNLQKQLLNNIQQYDSQTRIDLKYSENEIKHQYIQQAYNIQIIGIMLKNLLIAIILVSLPHHLSAYTCADTINKDITLGNQVVLCIHIVTKSVNESVQTYAFKTNVDTFSALKINGLTNNIKSSSDPIYAVVQLGKNNAIISPQALIFNKATNRYRSILSFVINIDKGAITIIVDDSPSCSVCATSSGQACDGDKCFDTTAPETLDPRFFISWIGTDNQDNYMLSHTKRLSRFSQYSIGSFYQGIVNQFK